MGMFGDMFTPMTDEERKKILDEGPSMFNARDYYKAKTQQKEADEKKKDWDKQNQLASDFEDQMFGLDVRKWVGNIDTDLDTTVPNSKSLFRPKGYKFDSMDKRIKAIKDYIPVVEQMRENILGEQHKSGPFIQDLKNRIWYHETYPDETLEQRKEWVKKEKERQKGLATKPQTYSRP